jgi:glycosyltransferase involved in cell wall biosynthesis
MELSATVIAQNEEGRIEACLSALTFCDEIVVLDSGSTDGTVAAARRFTDRVFQEAWPGFAAQKNRAAELARGRWVLSVDADEVVPADLAAEIQSALNRDDAFAGYEIPRRNYFGGVWVKHGGWYPDRQRKLWQKDRGRFVDRLVHERLEIDGPVGRLGRPLDHYTYDGFEDYLARMETYAELSAQEYFRSGLRAGPLAGPLHAGGAFMGAFLWRLGFLDGFLGWRLALLAGRYARLKYRKLRAKQTNG